jgi:TetR/AcrR family transcriptional regulator, transcriptional repressor for nem operon
MHCRRHGTTLPKYVQDNILLAVKPSWRHTSPRSTGGRMPYPANHRVEKKRAIIDSARKLFNRSGFDNVSLQEIMAGAGLTHGGFYTYFKSKSDLYAEVLGCFFTDPNWKSCWEGVKVDLSSTDVGSQVVRAYLSRQHFEDVENSCPMVALPTDVARSGPTAKGAFETVFRAMVSVLERSMTDRNDARRRGAQGIAAMCIGGMIVARTVVDRALADELRASCMVVAHDLAGWKPRPNTNLKKFPRHGRKARRTPCFSSSPLRG